jgi:hypothetical protein
MEKKWRKVNFIYGIVISIFELNNIDRISSAVPYHSIVEDDFILCPACSQGSHLLS